jgi:serine/threonine protein kinase
MSYCLNPNCPNPQNPEETKFCLSCGSKLLLKERYRAIRPLGEGGFGRTFLAVDKDRLNASCVIKQFFPQFQGTTALQKATELFSREAVRLHELGEHPQIPSLLAYFEQEQRLYLIQEFVDGLTLLQELQQRGAFSEQQVRELLLNLLPVLQFIHEHGVVHRDLKPENILRRKKDGKFVLVDFGVASQGTGTASVSNVTRAGTQGYAPMEQIRGGQAYPASDLYSLGVTCIQLLTALMPDDLYDPTEGLWIWREQLAKKGILVSADLTRILDKMLQDLVRDRYQSAAEVLQALNADNINKTVVMGASIQPPPPPPPPIKPPVKPPAVQPNPRSDVIISAELEAVKSHFSQVQPPAGSQSPPAKNQPGARIDPIQAELEKLKKTIPPPAKNQPGVGIDPIQAELDALKSELEKGE